MDTTSKREKLTWVKWALKYDLQVWALLAILLSLAQLVNGQSAVQHFGGTVAFWVAGTTIYPLAWPLPLLSELLRWWAAPLVLLKGLFGVTAFPFLFAVVTGIHVLKFLASRAFAAEEPKDGKLRILLVGDAFEPKCDGVATFTTQACKVLSKMGHSLHIITSIRKEPLHGVPVTCLPGVRPPQYPVHSLTQPSLQAIPVLWSFRPHIVHLVDENFIGAFIQLACSFLRIPTVCSHHTRIDLYDYIAPDLSAWGLLYPTLHSLRRLGSSGGQSHLAVCQALKDQLEDTQCHDVRIWNSGTDIHKFHPRFRRDGKGQGSLRWQLTDGKPDVGIILYVGRVGPEKGLHYLDKIADIINGPNNEHQKVAFVIVGDGPYRAELQAKCAGRAVKFLGFMPQNEVLFSIYSSSDVFFSGSTTEAFALVFLEAMASGLPVVGANAGGVPEAFEHGQQGFIFEPDNAAAAAVAIQAALAANAQPQQRLHGQPISTATTTTTTSTSKKAGKSGKAEAEPVFTPRPSSATSAGAQQQLSAIDLPPRGDSEPLPADYMLGQILGFQTRVGEKIAQPLPGSTLKYEELHIREKSRIHAESLSWEETYRQAVDAYFRARREAASGR